MSTPPLKLITSSRFGPLLTGLCLGAFGDNIFRNALVMLVQFRLAAERGFDAAPYIALAPGLFMLPYFLFSGTAGQLADRMDKAKLMQRLKFIEIFLMALAGISLISGNLVLMCAALFLAGLQSAFYSPVKYAILPQHLGEADLLSGNAIIGAGVFLSILLGTIAGGVMVLLPFGPSLVAGLLVLLSILGWITALYIPPAPASSPDLMLTKNPLRETWAIVKTSLHLPKLPLVILGHAGFWIVSTLIVGQMPAFVKDVLHANPPVFTFFFTLFSVGIGAGALIVRRLLKDTLDGRFVALGTLGLALGLTALGVTAQNADVPATLIPFLANTTGLILTAELVWISVFAGIFIVPLNALLQHRAPEDQRARVIAASNVCDSGGIVLASGLAAVLLALGFSIPSLWLMTAIGLFLALPLLATLVPHLIMKQAFRKVLRALFDVTIEGADNCLAAGPKAVIVANHVSLLDGLLLAAFLPGNPLFVVDTAISKKWWVKPFLRLADFYTVDPTQPMAIKNIIERVSEGRQCVIFPEGRITTTGSLMKINEGPGLIADKANAPIIPIRIAGAEYTRLSYLQGLMRRRNFPRIQITVLPPRRFTLPEGLSARERRALAAQKMYDLMSDLIFTTSFQHQTLVEALIEASATHGGSKQVLEDTARVPVSFNSLITQMLALSHALRHIAPNGQRVGVMLPSSIVGVATLFALSHRGAVPALLNFTSGAANCVLGSNAATLRHVITSRSFIAKAGLEGIADALTTAGISLVYLEDVARNITLLHKLLAKFATPFASYLHKRHQVNANDAAVVLFTSGSEGAPKGVVLSHKNLQANRWQVSARLDFSPKDILLNALPLFHSFGLTGGLLIPLLAGAKVVLYPSPLHYRIVPLLAYDCNATILFGTDTFLTGYARMAHPYDFYNVRFVCAGAEKVRDETRRIYADRFGVRILEGYGATETAPVLSVNTLMHSKAGTVGRLLPAMTAKLEPVPGITDGARLYVSGPNIMLGYLKADKAGVLEPPPHDATGPWHDTGDIVTIDDEGYITIKGRAKRFAKIAGEMVSLGAVEALAAKIWPDSLMAAVTLPDARKGEQIVLVTTAQDATLEPLQRAAKDAGQTELMVPKIIQHLEALPLLGSGKIDYVSLKRMVEQTVAQTPDTPEAEEPAP